MASKVFISYRRDDSAGHAGRVHDRLEQEFGRDVLFMDVDSIPLGANFVKVLGEEVAKCDALLAMIGPGWLDARDEKGKRRLENPDDFVRIEIGTALKRGIPVIPILLEGTRTPKADYLPNDLAELPLRNGLDVRHASFPQDMERLIDALKGLQTSQGTVISSRPGAVSLHASLFQRNHADDYGRGPYYEMSREGELIKIKPVCEYLDRVWHGGVIFSSEYWHSRFDLLLPALDLKFVNNSDKTIVLTEVRLDIEKSIEDKRPIILLKENEGKIGTFLIINDGWGELTNCTISCELYPDCLMDNNGSPVAAEKITLADFADEKEVDISPVLQRLGVNIAKLREFQCRFHSVDEGLARSGNTHADVFGHFTNMRVFVKGNFHFTAPDRLGADQDYVCPFTVRVWLAGNDRVGAPLPPSAEYSAKLRYSGAEYSISVPVSHSLVKGEADRFTLKLCAERSSSHRMTVTLVAGDEVLATSPVDLELLFPKSWKRISFREALAAKRIDLSSNDKGHYDPGTEAVETKQNMRARPEMVADATSALLALDFTKALAVADRARAFFPNDLWIESMRATALMFMGRSEEAQALYLAHKGKPISKQDSTLWERVIAEDFAKLREYGLTHPMMADIKKQLGVGLSPRAPLRPEMARALADATSALLALDFTKVLAVADRARAFFPNDLRIESMRATALMFMGRSEEAQALYLAHKGKPISEQDSTLWERVIAEDFAKLREYGLRHPMMADIKKQLGVSR